MALGGGRAKIQTSPLLISLHMHMKAPQNSNEPSQTHNGTVRPSVTDPSTQSQFLEISLNRCA